MPLAVSKSFPIIIIGTENGNIYGGIYVVGTNKSLFQPDMFILRFVELQQNVLVLFWDQDPTF